MRPIQNISKGILRENPVFILVLGLCPALAVTDSMVKAIGMGLTTTFVLILSNATVSIFKDSILEKTRSTVFLVIIATFVTVADLLLKTFFPEFDKALGIYVPLIVINSIILGRAEKFAQKNNVVSSIFDGFFMGIGFTIALLFLGTIRETLGNGSFLGYKFVSENSNTILFFILPPGAFIVYGFIIALFKYIYKKNK
ncbi:MAG TPA: RnfABCDGE type electron transport complex subunit E [Bacteroidales bacterium]|nr:RnfABCDGE type electron transport complex subunit E [Bacteroidales bacterium]HPS17586.1 RnfABCDGE type electron transport complex subunit E [Bacteroidales bacterium]